jgi:hypothetical protein
MTDDLVMQLRQASMTNEDYRWKAADLIERLTAALKVARMELSALVKDPLDTTPKDWPLPNPADAECVYNAWHILDAAIARAALKELRT